MPVLNRRRPAPSVHHSLVAAAARVKITDKREAARLRSARQEWQSEAWDYFDAIGEIKQSFWLTGNQLSKLRLFAAARPDPAEAPIPVDDPDSGIPAGDAAKAAALLARLRGPFGGHPEIIRETNMNFDVAGECFLVGRAERPPIPAPPGRPDSEARPGRPEEWDIKSIEEVKVDEDGNITVQFDDTGSYEKLDESAGDMIIRLWLRHPRNSWKADSPMHGVLGECEAVLIYSALVRGEGRSRLFTGKILKVPEELSFGPPDPTHDGGDGEAEGDPFIADLLEAMMEPVGDEDSAAAVAPLIVRGKAEHLAELDVLDLGRDMTGVVEDRIDKRIVRIARGVNMPLEKMMGHQATTFANAAQVDRDDFDDHLEPRATLLCDALTVGYLRPLLLAEGVSDEVANRVMVWFDPGELVADPQRVDNVKTAMPYLGVDAILRELGFDPADAASEDELLRRMGVERGITGETLTLMLLRLLRPDLQPEPLPQPEQPEAAAAAVMPTPIALTAAPPQRNVGRLLVDIDRTLRTRLEVAADAALRRALERAGARLRAKVGSARSPGSVRAAAEVIAAVDNAHAAATLGPALVAQAGVTEDDLLAGAFDGLAAQWDLWVAQAQTAALATVDGAVGPLTRGEAERVREQQDEDRSEAWAWLLAALTALARARLFDPSPRAPDLGEHDTGVAVPPGIIREAAARAGGAAGLESGPGGVALVQGGTRPAGGVATGQLLDEVLSSHGAVTSGWEWDYGPAPRSRVFEPHLRLDGLRFEEWSDQRLVNYSGFPSAAHYAPGDHPGCLCDAVPIVVTPAQRAA